MRDTRKLLTVFAEYESMLLEPKVVSGWLGLPGSQLPRETAKIIGQPARPARKKGSSAQYSFKDAILMKLGRTLMEMGITPHRVRACVGAVSAKYDAIRRGHILDLREYGPHRIYKWPFFLIGRERKSGFAVWVGATADINDLIRGRDHDAETAEMAFRSELSLGKEPFDESLYEKAKKMAIDDPVDTSAPMIVQNVTEFVQRQTRDLNEYFKKIKE